jgi:hypothetical protein
MKAYKFLKDDCKSGKGNEPAWKEGETRTLDGEIEMCVKGYHASPSWLDALVYTPGSMACIVDLVNPVKDGDKWVSNTCTIVKMVDATKILRIFACDCAERALKRANVTDARSWNAIKISRLYNNGQATKDELATARAAAWATAWAAAMDAARDAAMDAAREAAWGAAREAAWGAAREAAMDAAREAAWGAAWDAARGAERAWQKQHFNKLMKQLFGE